MTDTATENVTTATPDSPYAPIFEASRPALENLAQQFNAKAQLVKSAGNPQDQVNEILSTSDDQNVVQYRQVREELENNLAEILEQIETYVKDHLMPKGEVDVEAETTQAKELRDQYKALANGLKGLPGGEEFLASLTKLESFGRGGNSGATGQQRSRFSRIEIKPVNADDSEYREVSEQKAVTDNDGKPTGEFEKVTTYSVLARELSKAAKTKVDTAMIYEHSNAANKNDGRPFEFALSIPKTGEEGSVSFMVRSTPKNS